MNDIAELYENLLPQFKLYYVGDLLFKKKLFKPTRFFTEEPFHVSKGKESFQGNETNLKSKGFL